ncbi:MAG: adenosylcobinamide-phosphate synthase CbiB [Myxococcota bacterium]
MSHLWAFAAAALLDRVNIRWPNMLHPVAWFGHGALLLKDRLFDPSRSKGHQLLRGLVLVVSCVIGALAMVKVGQTVGGFIVDVIVLSSTFTISGLVRSAREMKSALEQENLQKARETLRDLCSRKPDTLNEEQLIAATVESVAENTSDSLVGPVFWFAIFGLPGAVAYRAVNTLDAMFGYRGEYEYFGKTAARLDDVLNLVPARITALLFWMVDDADRPIDLRPFWRDRRKTQSPNAGYPMAMMAALLGVRLSKPGHYELGDAKETLTPQHIEDACRRAERAAALMIAMVVITALIPWSASSS